ncbi:hypothetical protein ACFQY7_31060 [Actinomadura luteofluorescens]|uniref:hypothetical protein n=1 Tax=Actinomadura luteofluorescens TaxID=46163 RepID=UPI003643235D
MRLDAAVDLVGGGRLGPGLSNAYDGNVYLLRGDGGAWLADTGSGLDQGCCSPASRRPSVGCRCSARWSRTRTPTTRAAPPGSPRTAPRSSPDR